MRFVLISAFGAGVAMAACPSGMTAYGDGSACTGGGRPNCGMWGNNGLPFCTCARAGMDAYGDGSACTGASRPNCALYGNSDLPSCACPWGSAPYGDGSACSGGLQNACAIYGNPALYPCCPSGMTAIGDGSACTGGNRANCARYGNNWLPRCYPTPPTTPTGTCTEWRTGTISGYDNLDTSDDPNAGSFTEYSSPNVQVASNFLSNVPVASIHYRNWAATKYHTIKVQWRGVTANLQSWDECRNEDCPDGGQCCDLNAAAFNSANPFLIDVERRTLARLFNYNAWDSTLESVQYQICGSFDPAPIAQQYGYTL